MKKRLWSMIMALVMMLTMIPVQPVQASQTGLPGFGFYKEPVASVENLIEEFTVTEASDTFYAISLYDTIQSYSLHPNLEEIATASLSADSKCIAIQVTGTANADWYYSVSVELVDEYGNLYNNSNRISLINNKPALLISWPEWNNGEPVYDADRETQSYLNIGKWIPNDAYMVFWENGTTRKLTANELVSSDESILKVYPDAEHPEITIIDGLKCGTATLSYTYTDGTGASKTASLKVDVKLPSLGYYSAPVRTESNYIKNFTITETQDTIYLMGEDRTIEDVVLEGNWAGKATVSISQDKTYAAINVADVPTGNWNSARVMMKDQWGTSPFNASLALTNVKPALEFCWADWNNNVPTFNPNRQPNNELNIAKWYTSDVYMLFSENGASQIVTASDLVSSDESILKVYADETYPELTIIEGVKCGTAAVSYTYTDGTGASKTVSMDVNVILPDLGFYTAPVATEANYVNKFDITEEQDTIYLISRQHPIASVELQGFWKNKTQAVISQDRTYATINVADIATNDRNSVRVTFDNGNWNGCNIALNNLKPALMYREADWTPEMGWHESTSMSLRNGFEASVGNNTLPLYFYFTANGTETKIPVSDLKVGNTSIAVISETGNGNGAFVEFIGFGETTISYTDPATNKTYSMPVKVDLPIVGCYSAPTASKENYLTEFKVTDTADTFYVVPLAGWKFTSVEPVDVMIDAATVSVAADGSYATIKINDSFRPDYWHYVEVSVENAVGENMTNYMCGVRLRNGKPFIALCWPWGEEGDTHGGYNYRLDTAKDYGTDVWVYFVEGEKETKLSIEDLKSTNENVIKIEDPGYDNGMVRLVTTGWGEAQVTYTVGGKTYTLDVVSEIGDFGYYTSATPSRDSWITAYKVTEENNEFWFIARNDMTFDEVNVTEDLKNIATYEINAAKNSIKFTITGRPVSGGEYGVQFIATNPHGGFADGFHGIFLMKDAVPEVEVGELPTVDPSKPVQNTVVGVDGEKAGEVLSGNATDVLTQIQDSMDDADASGIQELTKKVSADVIEVVLEALNRDADIKLAPTVEATPVRANQSETIQADVDEMKQAAGNGTLAQVLDLNVKVEVYMDGTLITTGSMYELDEPVVFTAVLPKTAQYAIQNVPEGCELDLYVLYVHNGKVSKITDVTLNADGSISFPAKEFSTYALVYEHVAKAPEVIATTPMYRLYNPNSGEHFYTGSVEERDMLDAAGWNYEGVAWNAPISQGAPVHRVYNPNSGDHHYTMSQEEVDMLVGFGWQYEGVAWNSAPQDHPDAVPQYRLYNPNADCGSHHYTSSQEEMDMLTSVGWIYEGIGWYGLTK